MLFDWPEEDGRRDDVSHGKNSDGAEALAALPADILARYEVFSYRNAARILQGSFPAQYDEIIAALRRLTITRRMIRSPGGSKSEIARYIDGLFDPGWQETRIIGDLTVRLVSAKGETEFSRYTRQGYLDGHRIDFVKGRVALDLEWNSKDQTYDRDLSAFAAFYHAGAIDLGVIITRGSAMNNDFFRGLGKVLDKDGREGAGEVYRKYGASTTWMGKLLYRLDAGRNGGCPVLAIGLTPACVSGD